ncbi:MAG: CPBP family intramembrane metalloprotease [Ruminococcaceae bacterium]|nr:CPBP family intramembrane metalloprotease [Oscillospiraceae bacterium]
MYKYVFWGDLMTSFNTGANHEKENFIVSFLRAIGFFLFYYTVRSVIFSAASIFFAVSSLGEEAYLENANMLAFISALVIVISLIVFFSKREKSVAENLYVGKPAVYTVLLAFLTGIFLSFAVNFVMSFLPSELLGSYVDSTANVFRGHIVWYILSAVIMAPVVEELIFRAMLISRLSCGMKNFVAILISSAVFGAVHGHILWSSYAFAIGILLGVFFVRSQSLIVSIALHFGFNLVSLSAFTRFNPPDIIYIISIPVCAILIFVFIMVTKKTAPKGPLDVTRNV